jgi:hypothetical protein
MSISVSDRCVIGVGGTSEMSTASRRAAVVDRHRIGAARDVGRRDRDEAAATRVSGLRDREKDAMLLDIYTVEMFGSRVTQDPGTYVGSLQPSMPATASP